MKKRLLTLSFCCGVIWGQVPKDPAIQNYIKQIGPNSAAQFDIWNRDPKTAGSKLEALLPTANPLQFVRYIVEKPEFAAKALAQQLASQSQVNKMLGSTVGSSGSTSLLSSSAVADFLSIATEYGAITQTSSGDVTTVTGNLVGLAGLYRGDPYWGCASVAANINCGGGKRFLRGISGTFSEETGNSGTASVAGTNAATGAATTATIPAGKQRMSAWGVRFDWLHKDLYDATADSWAKAMKDNKVSTSSTEAELDAAVPALMDQLQKIDASWKNDFMAALTGAQPGDLESTLKTQLDALISKMTAKDPTFTTEVQRAQNAVLASFKQRDDILQGLQSNKFSTEFNSRHPLGQPNLSNVRLIYSYQLASKGSSTSPSSLSPLLVTFNGAAEWYDSVPTGVKVSRLRDMQIAAQLDESISAAGNSVLTFGYYYQWMKDNALITIPAGTLAPGTEIVLPGAASTLLATKGSIDIFQAKWTFPMKSGAIKVPISFTWSNRTELINEQEKRGQIGLTLDLDSVFQKQ